MLVRTTLPDLNLESMLPAIDEVIMGQYNQYPPQHKEFFRVMNSTRGIEQTTEVTGFGQFSAVNEGQNVQYDQVLAAFNKTYRHAQFGLGFKATHVAQQDDQYGIVAKMAKELGKSAVETREVIAANVINTAFSANGFDGVPLFSAIHPLVGGGVQSNVLPYAADPDVTSLQIALGMMRKTRDHRGKLLRIAPKQLVVPGSLEFLAAELLGGSQRSDTANNAINSFKRRSGLPSFEKWSVWDYLTDDHMWFIQSDLADTEMRFYDREKFNTLHDTDFDSRSIKTAGWMRFSCGYNGFYGMFGCPGS